MHHLPLQRDSVFYLFVFLRALSLTLDYKQLIFEEFHFQLQLNIYVTSSMPSLYFIIFFMIAFVGRAWMPAIVQSTSSSSSLSVPLRRFAPAFSSSKFCTSGDTEPPPAPFNAKGLKVQVDKHLTRVYKKIGKASPDGESMPRLQSRLEGLLKLQEALEGRDEGAAKRLADELNVKDQPMIQDRPPPKQKGPSSQAPSRKVRRGGEED